MLGHTPNTSTLTNRPCYIIYSLKKLIMGTKDTISIQHFTTLLTNYSVILSKKTIINLIQK